MSKTVSRLLLVSFVLIGALTELQPAGVIWALVYAYLTVAWVRRLFALVLPARRCEL
jgi:hypothetical protein